jgi:macrodomain Ter protein organizer (MatP/YcbG family)
MTRDEPQKVADFLDKAKNQNLLLANFKLNNEPQKVADFLDKAKNQNLPCKF